MNYLKPHLESLFREVTGLKANLMVLSNFVEFRTKDLKGKFPVITIIYKGLTTDFGLFEDYNFTEATI